MTTCSVVIPTRNRKESLQALLKNLQSQTRIPDEVLIVDSSTPPLAQESLHSFNSLPLRLIPSSPSTCIQRNRGIRSATGELVFLCDDDIELEPDYLRSLIRFLEEHPEAQVVTGTIVEQWEDRSVGPFPPMSGLGLIWRYCFMLSIWTDLASHSSPIFRFLKGRLLPAGNRLSPAGWPRVMDVRHPYFTAQSYGLGACVARKAALLNSPYDEILDEHGIGDHYGMALGLTGTEPITILTETRAFHRKTTEGRIAPHLAAFRRVLALDYFRLTIRPHRVSKFPLLWSLIGLILSGWMRRDTRHARALLSALRIVFTNSNPYVEARRSGIAGPINPELG